ncbi:MAG: class I SAM-dependent RNA methyltransferase [Anaerolineae bacterium]
MSKTKRIVLSDMGFRGDTVTRVDDETWFVAGGIPGEEVVVERVKRDRRFVYARVKEVVEPAPQRVDPPCPYFGRCGGCQWQHVDYETQLAFKTDLVREQLRRRGDFEDPPVRPAIGMDEPWHYRNQARFTIGHDGELGFNEHFTRRFLPIDECLILHPKINEVLHELQGRCSDVKHQLVVRYGFHTGELMVFPQVPVENLPFETGQRYFHEALHGHRFQVFDSSFFQTNTLQAERLGQLVQEKLALTGSEVVVDAYCGVGAFGVLLAEQVGRVIGIEESATAIADARENIKGIDSPSTPRQAPFDKACPEFIEGLRTSLQQAQDGARDGAGSGQRIELIEGKTEEVLPQLEGPIDAVILDPPRAGCRPVVLQALIELRPPRIIYVSCDPYTLARDLRILVDGGFDLIEVQPVDMFPQTYHVESVTTLYHHNTF